MIPKGLLIAVVTGITAGAITGAYFQNLNSQSVMSANGSALLVNVEKQDYKLGQSIQIQITNSGTTELVFSDDVPSLRIRALDGTVFFSTSFDGLKLEPRQQHTFEWNQQKNDNSTITQGRYVVDSFAHDQTNQKIGDSTTINILQ